MTDEAALRRAVLAAPDLDRPRLDYADGVAAFDPDRAELIRLQVEIASYGAPSRSELQTLESKMLRELELLDRNQRRWAGPFADLTEAYAFHRGFIADISASAEVLSSRGGDLFAREPIQCVRLSALDADLGALLGAPWWRQVRALDLSGLDLEDDAVRTLSHAAGLEDLVWLSLEGNPRLGTLSVAQIAVSSHLRKLRWLGLRGTGADATPRPDPSAERDGIIRGWVAPPLLQALRDQGQEHPWMTCDAVWLHNYPPLWWVLLDQGVDVPGKRLKNLTVDQVGERVKHLGAGRPLLLIRGFKQRGQRPRQRVGVFALGEAVPERLVDAWVDQDEVDRLADKLRGISGQKLIFGHWDAAFALGWGHLWTEAPAPFTLWSREGEALAVTAGGIQRTGAADVSRSQIAAIELYAEEGWVVRGLRVRDTSGQTIEILTDRDPTPTIDPTYDHLNLTLDTSWLARMGRDIAAALDTRFVDLVEAAR